MASRSSLPIASGTCHELNSIETAQKERSPSVPFPVPSLPPERLITAAITIDPIEQFFYFTSFDFDGAETQPARHFQSPLSKAHLYPSRPAAISFPLVHPSYVYISGVMKTRSALLCSALLPPLPLRLLWPGANHLSVPAARLRRVVRLEHARLRLVCL